MSDAGQDRTPDPGRADPARRRRAAAEKADKAEQRPLPNAAVVIAVGNVRVPGADVVAVAGPEAIDAALLSSLGADCVVCPLFDAEFDAMAVAARLEALGYVGKLQIIAPELPNPRMVEREIRSQARSIKLQILQRP
jgi:hypothetical protein